MRTQMPQHLLPTLSVGELFCRMSCDAGEKLQPGIRLVEVSCSILCSNPNMPRSIRARVGATSDPIPKGKHIEEPK